MFIYQWTLLYFLNYKQGWFSDNLFFDNHMLTADCKSELHPSWKTWKAIYNIFQVFMGYTSWELIPLQKIQWFETMSDLNRRSAGGTSVKNI